MSRISAVRSHTRTLAPPGSSEASCSMFLRSRERGYADMISVALQCRAIAAVRRQLGRSEGLGCL